MEQSTLSAGIISVGSAWFECARTDALLMRIQVQIANVKVTRNEGCFKFMVLLECDSQAIKTLLDSN